MGGREPPVPQVGHLLLLPVAKPCAGSFWWGTHFRGLYHIVLAYVIIRPMAEGRIVVHFSGGLGNQLFSFATALRLARESGRKLVIDTSGYVLVRDRKYCLDAFPGPAQTPRCSLAMTVVSLLKCTTEHFGIPGVAALMRFFGVVPVRFDVRKGQLPDDEVLRLAKDPHVKTVYMTGCNERMTLLPPRGDLREQFALTTPVAFEDPGEGSVSIHVRRGDYLSMPGGSWALGENYYLQAVEKMRSLVERPKWYVFSDDIDWCRKKFSNLGDVVIAEGDLTRPWEDLARMALCRHHIIANSTFSWWGAYLSRVDGYTICPRHWLEGVEADSGGLVPEDWILCG